MQARVRSEPASNRGKISSPDKAGISRLKPGASVKRRISGKTVHSYRVVLEKDQFLHVTVDQQDVDIVATVFDPAGNEMERVDDRKQGIRPERVKIIAEARGAYLIEVSAVGEKTGKYYLASG